MTDVAVCVALGTFLHGKLPASGGAAGGVSAADFVPECAGDVRRYMSRFRHSEGVRRRARQDPLVDPKYQNRVVNEPPLIQPYFSVPSPHLGWVE